MCVLTFGCMSWNPEVDTGCLPPSIFLRFSILEIWSSCVGQTGWICLFLLSTGVTETHHVWPSRGWTGPELRSLFLGSNHLTCYIISSSPKSIFKIFLQKKGERSATKLGHWFKPTKLLGENKGRFEHRRCSLRTSMLKHTFRCSM